MKLTEEKLKKIIKEEIEKAAQKTKMSPDMLKGLLVQFLNEK